MSAVTEFRMPSLGADMDSGVLLEWLVHPGDTVHKGDIVAVVDTAKAAVEVECFATGVIRELLVQPGTRVPVGGALATIETDEPVAPSPEPLSRRPEPLKQHTIRAASERSRVTSPLVRRLAQQLHVDPSGIVGTGEGGRITHADVLHSAEKPKRVKASPLARRMARELGVELSAAVGTGAQGAIIAGDIRRAQATATRPTRDESTGTDAMRSAIAALMAKSKREIPHYYLTEQIDLGRAMHWLHERNRAIPVGERLVPAVMLLKAAARAAMAVPQLNGFWRDGGCELQPHVHLGVAVSLRGGGLVAPAIHDADQLSLADLMATLRDLVVRTRSGRLRSSELADPTITVSNLGEQGAESILGVIYPPQVALVGFGRIVEHPWAVEGMLGIRPIVMASLSADHRATDGATGSRYLQTITQLLQKPEEL